MRLSFVVIVSHAGVRLDWIGYLGIEGGRDSRSWLCIEDKRER